MHSRDPQKDPVAFQQEIDAILEAKSQLHRCTDRFDFCGFVFPTSSFSRFEFKKRAFFRGATFTQNANFYGATFKARAHFSYSRFRGEKATFTRAVFEGPCEFADCFFAGIADFSSVRTAKDAEVIFLRVNRPGKQDKTHPNKSEQAAKQLEEDGVVPLSETRS
jgi:hypothetical protein